jgi:predicted membrane chloride channel (bestrophin family)
MGLETVSIELDNPFGKDDIDFNNLGMAYVSAEQKGKLCRAYAICCFQQ